MQLDRHFLLQKAFSEHHKFAEGGEYISADALPVVPSPIYFMSQEDRVCVQVGADRRLNTSYFVGVDWLGSGICIYVEPKLIDHHRRTDYLRMLLSALRHPEIAYHTEGLFEIKFDAPAITITQEQDMLTPLLVIQFLGVMREIVRKGLKKAYYPVKENLFGRVKGKILVGASIKTNLHKNKTMHTYCQYDEFGVDHMENRLLKKALLFVRHYWNAQKDSVVERYITESLGYTLCAFDLVSDEVDVKTIRHTPAGAFYKEYREGLRLAALILRRFGYNINRTSALGTLETPPFWIDMSKLFELYVLGLLKDRFKEVGVLQYHFGTAGNELDFLLNTEGYKMVIDAKYKRRYNSDGIDSVMHADIRQLSGYARLQKVIDELEVPANSLVDCLIVYPDDGVSAKSGCEDLIGRDLRGKKIDAYSGFYKIGVRLP